MKNLVLVLIGVVVGSLITLFVCKFVKKDAEIPLESINASTPGILSFSKATEDSARAWVNSFNAFNQILNREGLQIEPALPIVDSEVRFDGTDVPCGLSSWWIKESDFRLMTNLKGSRGFKIYPAIRTQTVQNTSGTGPDEFIHRGFTLIFSPTDSKGRDLIGTGKALRTFEYVDPCPTECKNLENDLCKRASLDPNEDCE